jgi:hypothetical protein
MRELIWVKIITNFIENIILFYDDDVGGEVKRRIYYFMKEIREEEGRKILNF